MPLTIRQNLPHGRSIAVVTVIDSDAGDASKPLSHPHCNAKLPNGYISFRRRIFNLKFVFTKQDELYCRLVEAN